MAVKIRKKGRKKNLQHPKTGTIHAQGTPWRSHGAACGISERFPLFQMQVTLDLNNGNTRARNIPPPRLIETEKNVDCKNCLNILKRKTKTEWGAMG